jgi:hypothetical protein
MDPISVEKLNRIVRNEVKKRSGAAIEINLPFVDEGRQTQNTKNIIEIKSLGHNK